MENEVRRTSPGVWAATVWKAWAVRDHQRRFYAPSVSARPQGPVSFTAVTIPSPSSTSRIVCLLGQDQTSLRGGRIDGDHQNDRIPRAESDREPKAFLSFPKPPCGPALFLERSDPLSGFGADPENRHIRLRAVRFHLLPVAGAMSPPLSLTAAMTAFLSCSETRSALFRTSRKGIFFLRIRAISSVSPAPIPSVPSMTITAASVLLRA